jgi:hypothetical protein
MITVIAPHARPEFSANLLANFRRQRGVEAQLLVVENGEAVGAVAAEDASVICSASHQADAMNAGLAWLRANGGGAWARWDDDDRYSPDYLAEVERELVTHEVVGKTWGFVLFDDGLYRFGGIENGHAEMLAGGTLAARTADVAPFKRFNDDDVHWCRDMRASGVELWAGPHQGYCYNRATRQSPRAIEGGPAVTRFSFGPSLFYGPQPMSAVDRPGIEPLCSVPPPSDDELVAELSAS